MANVQATCQINHEVVLNSRVTFRMKIPAGKLNGNLHAQSKTPAAIFRSVTVRRNGV